MLHSASLTAVIHMWLIGLRKCCKNFGVLSRRCG